MSEKKITIKDIAKMANVSPGTVDRVIHKRGSVSPDKQKRVGEILERINYQPNLIAQTLKNNRIYQIAVLMPDPERDVYWERASMGLDASLLEFGSFGTKIERYYFDPSKLKTFQKAVEKIIAAKPSGVLIAPMFSEASDQFFSQCQGLDIPVITFNTHHISDIPKAFVGQDLLQSGRLAGNLLTLTQKFTGRILLIHIDETPDNTRHVLDKETGLRNLLAEKKYPASLIESYQFFHSENADMPSALTKGLNLRDDISGVFISTSKAYEVASSIKKASPQCIIAGYDLISENTDLLKKGTITFLIDQSPFQQA